MERICGAGGGGRKGGVEVKEHNSEMLGVANHAKEVYRRDRWRFLHCGSTFSWIRETNHAQIDARRNYSGLGDPLAS